MDERSVESASDQVTRDQAINDAAGTSASDDARRDVLFFAAIGVGILVALVILGIFRAAPHELTVIGVGVLLGLALDPVLRVVQQRFSCSRAVGTMIVGAGFVVVFGGIMVFLAPQAADQASEFADELPATIEEFYSWPIIGQRLEDADAIGKVEQFVDDLPSRIDTDSISDVGGRVLGGLSAALLVLIIANAVLLDGEALVARFRRAIPAEHRERADEVGRIVYRSVARYFAGSVSVALLNGAVILAAGLVLGIPLAPLAAVWAAVTNLIPQIGGFLGGSFFVLLAITQGAVPGIIAGAIFLVYQQIENNVIAPTVIGKAIDLTPPTTMLAALIGGAAAGVPGALVATPLIGAIKSVWLDTHGQPAGTDDPSEPTKSDEHPSALRRLIGRLTPSS